MKYLKTFENTDEFKPGDYVKIIPPENCEESIKYFLRNNIGVIYNKEKDKFFNVKFENVPEELIKYTRYMGTNPPQGLKQKGEIFTAREKTFNLVLKEISYLIKATPKEIEEHKLKISAIKYNII